MPVSSSIIYITTALLKVNSKKKRNGCRIDPQPMADKFQCVSNYLLLSYTINYKMCQLNVRNIQSICNNFFYCLQAEAPSAVVRDARARRLQRTGYTQRSRQDLHRLQQQPRAVPQGEPMVSLAYPFLRNTEHIIVVLSLRL
jgi:hypothetical protein